MSWKEKMKEFGGADLGFLSEDGEVITFIVVGEPVLLEGKFKGSVSQKIGCPVVTADGFTLLVAGKRLARKISKYEERFADTVFMAIRHGEQDDVHTKYELKTLDDSDLLLELRNQVQSSELPELIREAVSAAEDVMKG